MKVPAAVVVLVNSVEVVLAPPWPASGTVVVVVGGCVLVDVTVVVVAVEVITVVEVVVILEVVEPIVEVGLEAVVVIVVDS